MVRPLVNDQRRKSRAEMEMKIESIPEEHVFPLKLNAAKIDPKRKTRRSFIQDGWKGCCSCLPPSQAVVSKDRRTRPERKRRNVGDEERGAPPSRSTACCCCPLGCWLPVLRSASRPCSTAQAYLDTPRCSSSCCPPASSCSVAISREHFGTKPARTENLTQDSLFLRFEHILRQFFY